MRTILIITFFLITFKAVLSWRYLDIKKTLFSIAVLILIIVAIFRNGDVLPDYHNYVRLFNDYSNAVVEPSFKIIAWIVHHVLFGVPILFFALYAIIGVSLKAIAIRQLSNFWLISLLIYFSNLYLLQELIQIRVGIATGFFLLCIKPLYDRKIWQFLIFASCATIFHYSAIIIFPLWFLSSQKPFIPIYLGVILVAYTLHFFNIHFSSLADIVPIELAKAKVVFYKKADALEQTNVFNIIQLIRICFLSIFALKINLIWKNNKYVFLLWQMYAIAIVILVIFADVPAFAFRLSDILGAVEIILIPALICAFKQKKIAFYAIVGLAFFLLMLNIYHTNLVSEY